MYKKEIYVIFKTINRSEIPKKEKKRIKQDIYGVEKLLAKYQAEKDNFRFCITLNVMRNEKFNPMQVMIISLLDSLYVHNGFIRNQNWGDYYCYKNFGKSGYFYITIEQLAKFLFPFKKEKCFTNEIKQTMQSLGKYGIVEECKYSLGKSDLSSFEYKYVYKVNLLPDIFKNYFYETRSLNPEDNKIKFFFHYFDFNIFERIFCYLKSKYPDRRENFVYKQISTMLKVYCSIVSEINYFHYNNPEVPFSVCDKSVESILHYYNLDFTKELFSNKELPMLQEAKLIYVINHNMVYKNNNRVMSIPRFIIKYEDYNENIYEDIMAYIKSKYRKAFKLEVFENPELKSMFFKYVRVAEGKTNKIEKIKDAYSLLYDYYLHCIDSFHDLIDNNMSENEDREKIIKELVIATKYKKDLTIFREYDFYKGDVDLNEIELFLKDYLSEQSK